MSAGQGEERLTLQGVPLCGSVMTQGVCVREKRQRDARRQRQGQIQGRGPISAGSERGRCRRRSLWCIPVEGPVTPVPSQPVSWSQ